MEYVVLEPPRYNKKNSITSKNETICCIVCFVIIFLILLGAICYTNYECFENFENTMKYQNDTIKNVLGGGKHYKALSPQDDVFEMVSKNNGKKAVVAVLADWCGHCKQLKSSGLLKNVSKDNPVFILDDNHPQASMIMQSVDSKGFPTITIMYNGQIIPYEGPRDLMHLQSALKN